MPEKLITKSFERILEKGKNRGFITYEELGKSLGKRGGSVENTEKAFLIIADHKITLVEKKSDFQSNKKKEAATNLEEKSSEKSDDPIRMYLREMGGVELLSREGEIAIAKRIEAGKDVMINALTQSPIVGKKIFEWREKIENQENLKKYGEAALPVIQAYGGKALVRGSDHVKLEGDNYSRIVIWEFPSFEKANECHDSKE